MVEFADLPLEGAKFHSLTFGKGDTAIARLTIRADEAQEERRCALTWRGVTDYRVPSEGHGGFFTVLRHGVDESHYWFELDQGKIEVWAEDVSATIAG
jgi:hypothetical protein